MKFFRYCLFPLSLPEVPCVWTSCPILRSKVINSSHLLTPSGSSYPSKINCLKRTTNFNVKVAQHPWTIKRHNFHQGKKMAVSSQKVFIVGISWLTAHLLVAALSMRGWSAHSGGGGAHSIEWELWSQKIARPVQIQDPSGLYPLPEHSDSQRK